MKKLNKTILAGVILAFACTSCTKTGATGPAGAAGATGPQLTGNLQGYVDLYDQYGSLMSPATGVYVTIAGKTGTDSTSSAGVFTKNNLTTGTYELNFAKTGYGATKIVSFNFTGGGTQYIANHIQMTQAPNFTLTGITVGSSTITSAVTVTVTPSSINTKARKVICFLSTSNTVSSTPGNYMGYATITIAANATTSIGNIFTTTLNTMGIVSGNTLFMAVYPISVSQNASTYLDITTGKTVFNNIGTTAVTGNVVVP